MRHVYSSAAVIGFLSISPFLASAAGPSIANYQLVTTQRVTPTTSYYTYKAALVNGTGSALPASTATLTSLNPSSFTVVAGQGTLQFPAVATGLEVQSLNSFTILVDLTVTFNFSNLQWTFLAPVANPGPNQTTTVGSTVTLDGSASTNPASTGTLTYSWTFTSVPAGSQASLSTPSAATTTFQVDLPGTYVIRLTVTNANGSNSASVTVSTVNSPPVAVAGPNQTVAVGALVTLNGSGSTDVDGKPLTYSWSLVAEPPGSQAALSNNRSVVTTFTADLAGSYVAQLMVSDGTNLSTPSTVTITTVNSPPVANAGPNQAVNVGTTVQLNGSGSTDVNGNLLMYKWSFNSLPSGSKAVFSNPNIVNPTFTADVPGTYIVQLVVFDGVVNSSPSTMTVMTNALQAPTANPGQAQTVAPGATVTLNGSGTDPQNLSLTYSWSLITVPANSTAKLSNPTSQNPTFVADLPGNYVAQLIVSNGFLNSPPATVAITTSSSQPVAVPGPNQNVALNAVVALDGTKSFDFNHNPLTFSWSFTALPQGSLASLQGPATATPSFVPDLAGAYVVQLIVNDGLLNSAPATVTITAGVLNIALTPNPLNLSVAPATLSITLGAAAGSGGVAVTLSGFDPTVIAVPTSIVVAENSTTATVSVTPVSPGSTNIIASAAGFQSGTAVVNVTTPSITVTLNSPGVGLTHTIGGSVALSGPVASPTTVTLTSAPAGSVTFNPPSITIQPGSFSGTFSVTGAVLGNANITAASTGYVSGTTSVLVVNLGGIIVANNVIVAPGQSTPLSVTLSSPAPVDGATVKLVSGDPTIFTVTSSVFIAAGATTPATPAQVTGILFGSASVTASAGGYSGDSETVTVGEALSFSSQAVTVGAGETLNVSINLSAPAPPAGLSITLSSSNPGVATVPSRITLNSGDTSAKVGVQGIASGTSTITASASAPNVAPATLSVTVSVLGSISLPSVTLGVGQTLPFPVTLTTQAPSGGVTVTLSSSDSTVVGLSTTTVNIAAGQTQPATQPTVTGNGLGQATITASAPSFGVTIQGVPVNDALSFNPPSATISGVGSTTLNLNLAGPLSNALTVNLSANPPNIVSLPPSVQIAAGVTTVPVSVTGVGGGVATITATSGNQTNVTGATASVTVQSAGAISLGSIPTVAPGQSATVTVTLSTPAPSTLTVTLVSSNPSVATIPSSVTIAAGQTSPSPQPTVTGVNFGNATINASAPGYSAGATNVTVGGALSFTQTTSTITGPASENLILTLSAPAPAVMSVSLGASPSGIVSVPGSVTIQQGANSVTVPVTGVSLGSTTITASSSAPNVTNGTSAVTVQSGGTIALSPGVSLNLGQSAPFQVTLPVAPANPVTVNLSSSDTSKVTISPATVTIPAGQTQPATAPQVTGVNLGTANILAVAPTFTTGTQPVQVTGSITLSPSNLTISGTSTQNLTLTLSGPAPSGGITFNLTSTNPSAATVGPTVTIGAGATTAPVPVTGVAVGSTTIQAMAANLMTASASVTVNSNLGINVPASVSVTPGNVVSFPISLVNPATGVVTLQITSADPTIATVSSSLIAIGQGATTSRTPITVNGVANGSTTVTVSAPGTNLAPATSIVNVGVTLSVTPATLTIVGAGVNGTMAATLSGPAPAGGTVVNLKSNDTTVVSVPPSVTIAAGSTSVGVRVTSVGLGSTTITFSATGLAPVTSNVIVAGPLTINTTTLPNGVSGSAYTATVAATGGTQPYTWSASGLPTGLAINSATGIISGTTAQTGTFTITVTAQDSSSPTASSVSKQLQLAIIPVLTITTSSLPGGIVGLTYSGTMTATGGAPPLTWSATGLPQGLSINSNTGAVTGTPTTAGTASVTITVKDSSTPANQTVTATVSLTIAPTLSITTASLPNGVQNLPYNGQLSANGGTPPYTWSVPGLPPGLNLNATTGAITGSPTALGQTTVTATVTDNTSPTHLSVSQQFTITIANALTITTGALPNGVAGSAYSTTLSVAAGLAPFSWSATGLPSGLGIDPASGTISGTTSSSGTFQVTVTVTDSTTPTHQTTSKQFSLVIGPALSMTTNSLAGGTAGLGYNFTAGATGGTTPYTWSATGLPAGLGIDPSLGVISGTTATSGTFTVTLTVTDATAPVHQTVQKQLSLTIAPALVISTLVLPQGVVNAPYSASLAAANGTAPLNWSATGLSATLSIDPSSGTISGIPTATANLTITITVTDSTTPTHQTSSRQFNLQIVSGLTITSATLPKGVANLAYSAQVSAAGGVTPLNWSASGLPSALTIDPASGIVSGSAGASGTFTVTVTVTDSTTPNHQTATKQLTLTIADVLKITTASLANGASGSAYSAPMSASGGNAPLTWSATGLPSTLSIDPNSGTISGTPTAGGTFTVNVTVTDSTTPTHASATAQFSLTIAGALTITTAGLPNGAIGLSYSAGVATSGGNSPLHFSATSLPSPLIIDPASGVISGLPATSGTFSINVTVTDSTSPTPQTASKQLSITIAPTLAITSASLPNGAVGLAYNTVVSSSGGNTPLTWTATGLPGTLTINASSGVISGTPGSSGTFTVNISVSDGTTPLAQVATKQLSLTIAPALTITTASLPNGEVGAGYNTTMAASGGNAPLNWSATGLPSNLSIDPSAGVITGSASTAGVFTVNVTVTDNTSPTHQSATKQFSLTIASALTITTTSLPNGAINLSYSAPLASSGGNTPLTWSAGGLPTGVNINPSTGNLSGVPSVSGTFTVNVTLTDSTTPNPQSATKQLTLVIAPALVITTASLPTGQTGVAYSAPLAVSGGNSPLTWSASGLPSPLTINSSSGVISGMPGAAGTFTVNVSVSDATSPTAQTATKQLTLTIVGPIGITTLTLPPGVLGTAYATQVAATGGLVPYSWSATGLPSPLTINQISGVISGVPAASGTFTITVNVSDSSIPVLTASQQFSLTISAPLTITTTSLPSGQSGVAYNTAVVATGGTTPLTWSATNLPSPLTINSSTGAIGGTPTGPGTFTVTITVTDSSTPIQTVNKQLVLIIAAAQLTITSTSLPNGQVGTAYATTVVHTGGTSPFNWSGTSGLPAGLSINTTTGQITGTPNAGGTFTANLSVTDSSTPQQQSASKSLTLIIQGLVITTTSLPTGAVGSPYSMQLTANGGSGQLTWTVSNLSPRGGLTLSASGLLSGTPNTPGTTNLSITVTDSLGASYTTSLPLTITSAVLTITTVTLPNAVVNASYQNSDSTPVQLTATGGVQPYVWTVSNSTPLPNGITLQSDGPLAGQLSGTPTTLGTTKITFIVTDSSGIEMQATASINLTVTAPGGGSIAMPSVTVGQNLQVAATITFTPPLPIDSVVTITSGDPNQILLGISGVAGSGSVTAPVSQGTGTIQTVIQASGSVGSVIPITVSLPGYTGASATATIANSGFVVSGPGETGGAIATFVGVVTPLTVYSFRMDSNGNPVESEQVRAGFAVSIPVASSQTSVGNVSSSSVTITGPAASATDNFVASQTQTGATTVTVGPVSGYVTPADGSGSVLFNVQPSGLIPFTATIGNNLQAAVTVSRQGNLSTATTVTVTSLDPSQLLFTTTPTGSAHSGPPSSTITVPIPANQTSSTTFYAHAYGSSGTAGYMISAPTYGSVTFTASLAPSGLVIQSPGGLDGNFTMQAGPSPAILVVNTYALDPVTLNPTASQALACQPSNCGNSISVTMSTTGSAGSLGNSSITINAGSGNDSTTSTTFTATSTGGESITASAPGFQSATVGVTVKPPFLLIAPGAGSIGQFLESQATVTLPSAPSSDVQITLTAPSGSPLMFSPDGVHWSSPLTITISAGNKSAPYWVTTNQSSGQATYTASATGYQSFTDTATSTPSGALIVTDAFASSFSVSLSSGKTQALQVLIEEFDNTGNLIGPQPVALPVTVTFSSTNPAAGSFPSLVVQPGTTGTTGTFTPTHTGSTIISVIQPFSGWMIPPAYVQFGGVTGTVVP